MEKTSPTRALILLFAITLGIMLLPMASQAQPDSLQNPPQNPETAAANAQAQQLREQAATLRAQADEIRKQLLAARQEPQSDTRDARIDVLQETFEAIEEAADELEEAAQEVETGARNLRLEITGEGLDLNTNPFSENTETDEEEENDNPVQVGVFSLGLGANILTQDGDFNLSGTAADFEQNYGRSVNVQMDFFPTRINLIKKNFQLLTSLSLDVHNYAFERPLTLIENTNPLQWTATELEGENITFSKLQATYFKIPLVFRVSTNGNRPNKGFRLLFGGYGSVLMSSVNKQKGGFLSTDDDKRKFRDSFNLNRLNYGVTAGIGIKFLELYCNYSLTPLFTEDQGPEFTPVTFGIRVVTL